MFEKLFSYRNREDVMNWKMSPRVFLVAAYVVLLSIPSVLLVSCGGGGGGDGGVVGDDGTSFSGNTGPAEINSANIVNFAEGVTGGVELPFMFSVDVAATTTSLVSTAKATMSSAAVSSAAVLPPSEHYEGSCGGTLDLTYSINESPSQIEVTGEGVAVNYCEDGTIPTNISTDGGFVDGTFTITMGESLDRLWENVSFSSFSASDSATALLMELDGSINMEWPVGGGPVYLENIVARFTDSGVVSEYWLKDFKLKRDNLGMNWILTGQVYYGEEGYVWLETTAPLEPLSPPYIQTGLILGTVVMHGETTDGRLLFNYDPAYKVELWNGSEWADMMCFDDNWSSATCAPMPPTLSNITATTVTFVQYRTFENSANDRFHAFIDLRNNGQFIEASDVQSVALFDKDSVQIVPAVPPQFFTAAYTVASWNTTTSQFESVSATGDSGYWFNLSNYFSITLGFYQFVVQPSQDLPFNYHVNFPAQTPLTPVASASMSSQWNPDGSLILSWSEPPDIFDQYRVAFTDASGEGIFGGRVPTGVSQVTLSASLLEEIRLAGQLTLPTTINWRMQTRNYDGSTNYARSFSDPVTINWP